MSRVFEAFGVCVSMATFQLHLMAFQNVLRLLPTSVTPSNEILLIRTVKPGSDVHEERPKGGLEQPEPFAAPSLQWFW
jgi:hypothetical protein